MSFKAYYLSPDGTLHRDMDRQHIEEAFASKEGLLWVDVSDTTEQDGEFLLEVFEFHYLAVENCVGTRINPPKVDSFGDHIFIICHGIDYSTQGELVGVSELGLFVGSHYVVSNHNFPLISIDTISRLVEEDGSHMRHGAQFLAHAMLDALVALALPTIDKMTEVAATIEEEAILNPHHTTLSVTLRLKRSALRIHRTMAPQREVMNRLSRGDYSLIGEEARIFYRNVYDNIIRMEDLNQSLIERADTALSLYLSAVANRQNETMRVLSIVASIFLPLSLLAGIYGMNFENMPELKWPWAYFVVLGFMVTVAGGVLWTFWAKKWVSAGSKRVTRAATFAVDAEHLRSIANSLRRRPRM
ncbi:MAG: magnesium/cobalt transporter CorA [Chloroflexi bacterium]|nr:magnesium/cobalt transporter CorA [Chloroflexota bacterium]